MTESTTVLFSVAWGCFFTRFWPKIFRCCFPTTIFFQGQPFFFDLKFFTSVFQIQFFFNDSRLSIYQKEQFSTSVRYFSVQGRNFEIFPPKNGDLYRPLMRVGNTFASIINKERIALVNFLWIFKKEIMLIVEISLSVLSIIIFNNIDCS